MKSNKCSHDFELQSPLAPQPRPIWLSNCLTWATRGSTVSIEAIAGTDYYFAVGSYDWNSFGCELYLGARTTLSTCINDGECDDGNPCTEDRCTDGSCANTEVSYGVACSNDRVECTDVVCSGTGECIHPLKPPGTPCGDPSRTSCTDPDSCDGYGTCFPQHVSAGQRCEADGNECTLDECNGAGACTHPSQVDGTTCTVDGTECARDVCSGGVCAHPPILGCCPNEVECCENANCDDRRYCTGVEICVQNVCLRGSPPCTEGEVCNEDADRCDLDCNRNGLPDLDEPNSPGLLITREFRAVAYAYVDSSAPHMNWLSAISGDGSCLTTSACRKRPFDFVDQNPCQHWECGFNGISPLLDETLKLASGRSTTRITVFGGEPLFSADSCLCHLRSAFTRGSFRRGRRNSDAIRPKKL